MKEGEGGLFLKQSKKIALGGMLAALSIVVLFLAGVIPLFVFAFPALAGMLLIPVCVEMDWKWGVGVYLVVSVLAILLVPDREVMFYYVCLFGHYPVTKLFLEKIRRRFLRILAKLATFTVSVGLCILLTLWLFGMEYVAAEFTFLGQTGLALLVVFGLLALLLYDFVLGRFSVLYIRMVRPRLRKLLG